MLCFHKSRMVGYDLSVSVKSKCLKSNLHTGPSCLTSRELCLVRSVSLSIKREPWNVLLRSLLLFQTCPALCLADASFRELGNHPGQKSWGWTFQCFRNCPQDRFQSTVKLRVQDTKPATTAFSWWHNQVSRIQTLFMSCHPENEKAILFSRCNSKFWESLKQDQPRRCRQNSYSTNVTDTHDCFSAACKCVLCCFLDEHSTHTSHSTSTATGSQM